MIQELIKKRNYLKTKLKELELELEQEIYNLPETVLSAVCEGIIKFNFPVNPRTMRDIKTSYKK